MGQTMAQKIIAKACEKSKVEVGEIVLAKVEMFTSMDYSPYIDMFYEKGLKVWNPNKIIYCFDHSYPQPDRINFYKKEHAKIRQFAKDQGIPSKNIYGVGRVGISHTIPVEQGWALPGTVCIGLDTQAASMGACNCFSIPTILGSTPIILTGDIWLAVPESVKINLTGELPAGVNGKDVVYSLLKEFGDNLSGKVIEFCGPALESIDINTRVSIANGAVQLGAMTIIFPADQKLLDYLKGRARDDFEAVEPDSDAEYASTYTFDLSSFHNMIAGPHDSTLVRSLSELEGLEVNAGYIGSCSNGRFTDLKLAADVLRGHKIHPEFRLVVTPATQDTMREAAASDVLQVLLDAGAMVTNPGCGACFTDIYSPVLSLADGERFISSATEAGKGRVGNPNVEILLASAGVVAASAIEGRVTNPAKYLK